MALTTQLGAVSNKRIRPNYVDIINAQTPYLPAVYSQRDQEAYQDESADIERQGLADYRTFENRKLVQGEEIAARNEALARESLESQEDQAKKARRLGYVNLGLQGALGASNLLGSMDFGGFGKEVTKPALSNVSDVISPSILPSAKNLASPVSGLDLSSGLSSGLSSAPQAGSSSFELSDLIPSPLKSIGSGVWDVGKGLYDATIGDMFSSIGGLFT